MACKKNIQWDIYLETIFIFQIISTNINVRMPATNVPHIQHHLPDITIKMRFQQTKQAEELSQDCKVDVEASCHHNWSILSWVDHIIWGLVLSWQQ